MVHQVSDALTSKPPQDDVPLERNNLDQAHGCHSAEAHAAGAVRAQGSEAATEAATEPPSAAPHDPRLEQLWDARTQRRRRHLGNQCAALSWGRLAGCAAGSPVVDGCPGGCRRIFSAS